MITFVGMSSRTSGLIRGIQMSKKLSSGAQFIELGTYHPSKNRIVIMIRNYDNNVVKFYKKQGCVVGYDIADMPIGDALFRNKIVTDLKDYAHAECDFFVVNNSIAKSDVSSMTNKPSFVIPHHSVNFENIRASWNDKVKCIGYIGLPEQLSRKSEIEKLCNSHNAKFISIHPNSREECDVLFRTIDIGIVFAESNEKMNQHVLELMKRYKPNVKLTNFQSYGIPSICTPYESYLEFGNGDCKFVKNDEEMFLALETMIKMCPEERLVLSNNSYHNGKKFHIDNIKKMYENLHTDITNLDYC